MVVVFIEGHLFNNVGLRRLARVARGVFLEGSRGVSLFRSCLSEVGVCTGSCSNTKALFGLCPSKSVVTRGSSCSKYQDSHIQKGSGSQRGCVLDGGRFSEAGALTKGSLGGELVMSFQRGRVS
eukprot:6386546-Amphidinium_carterae.1